MDSMQSSKVILLAILPYLADFGSRLGENMPNPLTTNSVTIFQPYDLQANEIGGYIRLTNGLEFWFQRGHVNSFSSPQNFYSPQDSSKPFEFYGRNLRMNRQETIAFARDAITNLGYSTEMLYADLDPTVKSPPKFNGHVVPRYLLEWVSPKTGLPSVSMEIDADNKSISMIQFLNHNLDRPSPKLDISPVQIKNEFGHEKLDPDELSSHLKNLPQAINEYAGKLGLPIAAILNTNEIAPLELWKKYGELIVGTVTLTNHYRFFYEDGSILGFESPEVFFGPRGEIRVKDFLGTPRIKQSKLIKIARETVVNLGLSPSDFHMTERPEITKPFVPKNVSIPRYEFQWKKVIAGQLGSLVRIELDAANGEVKSLFIDSNKLRNQREEQKNRSQNLNKRF